MKAESDISAQLMQLAEFAKQEDWLYALEVRLASAFSLIAQALVAADPRAEVICSSYIGVNSALLRSARSSNLGAIKSIERSLDRLQAFRATSNQDRHLLDCFAFPNPAQTFLRTEIIKRKLKPISGKNQSK